MSLRGHNYNIFPAHKMEFPPPNWDIFPGAEFENAMPRNPGNLGAEVMAQVRPNGRILDHIRIALDGSEQINLTANISTILPIDGLPEWKLVYNTWPRDILMRRNMTTSDWFDLRELLASNTVQLTDNNAQPLANEELLARMNTGVERTSTSCSFRWATCVGADQRLELQLQSLPAPANSLSGKPSYRG